MDSGLIITLTLAGLVPPLYWKPSQLIGMMSGYSNRSNWLKNAIIPYPEPPANANKSLLASSISTPLVILNSIRLDKRHNNIKT